MPVIHMVLQLVLTFHPPKIKIIFMWLVKVSLNPTTFYAGILNLYGT
jgi:hypothetical protein